MSKKEKIKCKCGHIVTPNTWKQHIVGKKCKMSTLEKSVWLQKHDLVISKGHKGWLISEGIEALAQNPYLSIMTDVTTIDFWRFSSPRPIGQVRESTAKRYSDNRKGINNPAVRNKIPNYDINNIKKRAHELLTLITSTGESFRTIINTLESEFVNFGNFMTQYNFKSNALVRGDNKENRVIAFLLDKEVADVIKMSHKIRGSFISTGQLKSPIFSEIASKMAAGMFSSFRCSKPHKILFEMIKEVDPLATMEHKLNKDKKWRSFDIYSPAIGSLIECHGRVWHDLSATNDGLRSKCLENIENDKFKEIMAIENNLEYIVFWDDETRLWFNRIKSIYGEETILYEEAKNRIS